MGVGGAPAEGHAPPTDGTCRAAIAAFVLPKKMLAFGALGGRLGGALLVLAGLLVLSQTQKEKRRPGWGRRGAGEKEDRLVWMWVQAATWWAGTAISTGLAVATFTDLARTGAAVAVLCANRASTVSAMRPRSMPMSARV